MVGFQQYVNMYVKDRLGDDNEPLKAIYEDGGDRWQVAVAVSDKGFQQVSFVNSIATTKVSWELCFFEHIKCLIL